jgi:hypothetical protein
MQPEEGNCNVHLHRDSIPGPINPYRVDIPVTLFRPAGLYVQRDKLYRKLYKPRTRLLEHFLILGSRFRASYCNIYK